MSEQAELQRESGRPDPAAEGRREFRTVNPATGENGRTYQGHTLE